MLEWIPYRVAAGLAHIGPDMNTGHYRSFLAEAAPGRGNQLCYRFRVTDDDSPSRFAQAAQSHLINRLCYLCFLVHDDVRWGAQSGSQHL